MILSVWQQTYGTNQPQGLLPGDATSDGLVAGMDFLAWQQSAGEVASVQTIDLK